MILLISDLHLEEERPDITRAFLRFLRERAVQADACISSATSSRSGSAMTA